jgi:peptidoglycan/LPS O-acetylase OafA/YrhL
MKDGDNFGAIRLLAAIVVVFGHSFPLSGAPSVLLLGNAVQSLAVKVFFVLSGYLIAQSWVGDPNPARYLAKRCLRIFPALICVVCLSALILGPAVTLLPISAYLRAPELSFYFRNMFLYPVYSLPGVFSRNIYPDAVNGSLWSLPVEFSMYLALPILACRPGGAAFRLGLAAALIGAFSLYELRGAGSLLDARQVVFGTDLRSALDVAPYFCAGACLYGLRGWIRPNLQMAMLLGAGALLAPPIAFYPELALYVALPYAVIAFALARPARFSYVERFGDLSYGTYLFGFPVQQWVIATFGTAHHPIRTFALALPPTLLLAFSSWHLIERRMMALKPRRRGATATPGPESYKFFASFLQKQKFLPYPDALQSAPAGDGVVDYQYHDGADDGDEQAVEIEPGDRNGAERVENLPAHQRADNAEHDVEQRPLAAIVNDMAGNIARN